MKTDEMVTLLKGMLSGKETIIQTLSDSLEESTRIQKGLSKAKESVLNNSSEKNLRKMLNVTMNSLETQSKTINQLVLICLVYSANSNFSSDVAMMLSKLGHGKEALREMFKQKMSGKL